MSLKELVEANEKGNVLFGLKQALKFVKSKKAKKFKVFVVNDARDYALKKLDEAGIEYSNLRGKEAAAKELNLDFECEVFLVK